MTTPAPNQLPSRSSTGPVSTANGPIVFPVPRLHVADELRGRDGWNSRRRRSLGTAPPGRQGKVAAHILIPHPATLTTRGSMIPITTVKFGPDEEREVLEVLRSGSIAQGPKVARLEDEFAAHARRPARDRGQQRHDRAGRRAPGARPAAGRRGRHLARSPSWPRSTRSSRPARRRRFADITIDDFNVDPHVGRQAVVGPAPRCSSRCTCTARWPTWPRCADSPTSTGCAIARGRGAVARRHLRRPVRRQLRPRHLLAVRDQEPHHR